MVGARVHFHPDKAWSSDWNCSLVHVLSPARQFARAVDCTRMEDSGGNHCPGCAGGQQRHFQRSIRSNWPHTGQAARAVKEAGVRSTGAHCCPGQVGAKGRHLWKEATVIIITAEGNDVAGAIKPVGEISTEVREVPCSPRRRQSLTHYFHYTYVAKRSQLQYRPGRAGRTCAAGAGLGPAPGLAAAPGRPGVDPAAGIAVGLPPLAAGVVTGLPPLAAGVGVAPLESGVEPEVVGVPPLGPAGVTPGSAGLTEPWPGSSGLGYGLG